MTTQHILDKVLEFIQQLTAFYSELSEELPENFLRIVVDNTRGNSEVKKMRQNGLYRSRAQRREKQNN